MIKISYMVRKDLGSIKAFFNVDIDDEYTIRDCKLVDGKNGYFVSMPSRQYEKDGVKKWSNYVDIKNKERLAEIERAAINEYGGKPPEANRQEKPINDEDFPF